MSILNEKDSLLLIIDIQEKLLNAIFNKKDVEKNSLILSKAASLLDIPVIITEQYPKGLGNTIDSIATLLSNKANVFEKISFSALDNDYIKNAITRANKKQIVIFGIETHICVSQTAYALKQEGYDVTLIENASGSRVEVEHLAGIRRMQENDVSIISTEIALFEWLRNSKHPKFKEVQSLIK